MLKSKQRFGKYVIERKLGEGGFAVVYQARDTIEGIRVALKIPYAHLVTDESIEDFRHEVRLAARLEHPNILPLKYADYVNGHFAIVTAIGQATLEERLQKRLSVDTALLYSRQMLQAVAYAHEQKIVHCDVKPDNFLLFPGNRLRLTDFGIARVAQKTLKGSGAGTVGYIAPEQAMGKPSFRSDVFALGIIMYRMFAGTLPEWPYRWPFPGYDRLRARLHPKLITVIKTATELESRKRFRDGQQMLAAFDRVKNPRRQKARTVSRVPRKSTTRNWKTIRQKEFQREFGKVLETKHDCSSCGSPVAESMHTCPWCGKARRTHQGEARFLLHCPRCRRGLKSDWRYCPWCYGPGFEVQGSRVYADRRYAARCDNTKCSRKELMPFMRYCPWCHRRVRRKWKIEGNKDQCNRCGWGVLAMYWSYCPWCAKRIQE